MAAELRFDGPGGAAVTLVLAHGAGAPMDSPFMEEIARRLAAAGLRVARFEFPYMRARRLQGKRGAPDREPILRASWMEVIERLGGGATLVIGGKSMGGRIASLIADEAGARGLVCLGYPFHAAGRPQRPRIEHLGAIRTPTLIVQGARDPMGGRAEVEAYPLGTRVRMVWIEQGDHSFKPTRRSGRSEAQNLDEAAAAVVEFVRALPR